MALSRRHARVLLLSWPLWVGTAPVVVPFAIVEPQPDQTVQAGAMLSVSVSSGPEGGTRRVSYFWYAGDTEPLSLSQAKPSFVADAATSPPFGGHLQVPVEGLGPMRLLAVAEVARGRMGTILEFDERIVTVEPAAPLQVIEFRVEKPWAVTPVGKIAAVPVLGEFADGVVRSLEGKGTGTLVRSGDERVVKALGAGLIRAVRPGRTTLTVENRGRRASLDVVVTGAAEENGIPVANPGPDQRVKGGARVRLSGVGSADPDGDPLRYAWTQVRGLKVDLVGPNESVASFVAPTVSATRLLRFRLDVTDMSGPDVVRGADSVPAYVDVWVEP